MPRWPPRDIVHAQGQALPILMATLSLPGASALRLIGGHPNASETSVAGVSTTVVRPAGRPPWPTVVFMNGATPDGRSHPTVQRLGTAMARVGIGVLIPELHDVAAGELSPNTLAQAVAVSEAAASSLETRGHRVALAGVSVGATLALLAAADPRVRRRVSLVACVAPFGDLAEVMRLATTGTYTAEGGLHRHTPPSYLRTGLARSLAAMLAVTPATDDLRAELRSARPDESAELPERAFRRAGLEAEQLYALLANTEPERFDELYDALPAGIHRAVASLSPVHVAHRIRAPVEIATAPHDAYFPLSQARALAVSSSEVRLTVTSLLAHATPRLSLRYLAELGRLDAFFVRALASATAEPPLHLTAEST